MISSTMLRKNISFEVSTPGKIILFGEHSVVYNKHAIAASLGLQTKLIFNETDDSKIHINLNKININEQISIETIQEHKQNGSDGITKKIINNFHNLNDNQKLALTTFFNALISLDVLVLEKSSGFKIVLDTDLSIGAGVGSSASFSVAISSALLLYEVLLQSDKSTSKYFSSEAEDSSNIVITEELKQNILAMALACEKIIHGNPSGIDHTTCTLGGMVKFRKTPVRNEIESVQSPSINVLLVDTKVGRSTKQLVAKVKLLREKHEEIVNAVLDCMDLVAIEALDVLQKLSNVKTEVGRDGWCESLGELIILNQNLLSTIRVSHERLDRICTLSAKYGLPAKLTGAGGGGYAFVYIPEGTLQDSIQQLSQELKGEGYDVIQTTLGGPGLQIKNLAFQFL